MAKEVENNPHKEQSRNPKTPGFQGFRGGYPQFVNNRFYPIFADSYTILYICLLFKASEIKQRCCCLL